MKRRKFIETTAMSVPLISMFPANLSAIIRETGKGKIEKRALGKTGEMLSMIGFGGIVVDKATTEQAASRVKEAIDHGINYFDVAPSYGNAEEMLGPALEPYRKDVFLAIFTSYMRSPPWRMLIPFSVKEAPWKPLWKHVRKAR